MSLPPLSSIAERPNTHDPKLVSTVSNIAEIFNAAGFAFKKLSELVHSLESQTQREKAIAAGGTSTTNNPNSNMKSDLPPEVHWETADVEQFRSIMTNFSDGLTRLSDGLKVKMETKLTEAHKAQALSQLTEQQRKTVLETPAAASTTTAASAPTATTTTN